MWLVCKTFLAKMSFICMRVKKSLLCQWLHSLALKKRLGQLENGLFDTTCTQTHAHFPTVYTFQENISFDESASLSSDNAIGA